MKNKSKLIHTLIELFRGTPRAAILMSGYGSNADVILKNRSLYPGIHFEMVISDNPNSRAKELAEIYQLNYHCITGSVKSVEQRLDYFKKIGEVLDDARIDVLIYAGFMKIAPKFFVEKYPGINIHPADMTLLNSDGIPKYRGMHCIKDAIDNGESYIAGTVHVVDDEVDCGTAIAVSNKLMLDGIRHLTPQEIHEKLKVDCEHPTFPYILKKLHAGSINAEMLPLQI